MQASPDPRGTLVDSGPSTGQPVVIDCDQCAVRGSGCGDCMVTVLLGGPPVGVTLDDDERRAIDVLARVGLIPPLRMSGSLESMRVVAE